MEAEHRKFNSLRCASPRQNIGIRTSNLGNGERSAALGRSFEAGGQGVNQRGIPVDGDFVGSVIPLFIVPVTGLGMWPADEIAGPRVRPVVAAGAAIMRVHRRS